MSDCVKSFGERLVGIEYDALSSDKAHMIQTKLAEVANLIQDVDGENKSYLFNLVKEDALRNIMHANTAALKLVALETITIDERIEN